jgi:hypothetical protein
MNTDQTSTYSFSLLTTVEQTTTCKSTTSSYTLNISQTTTNQPVEWQLSIITNDEISLESNISTTPCLMIQLCLKNITCLTTSLSSYNLKHTLPSSKQRVNRFIAYGIILIMVFSAIVIILMNALKYAFKIAPIENERQQLQQKKHINRSKEQKPTIIRRSIYASTPQLEPIFEEYEV